MGEVYLTEDLELHRKVLAWLGNHREYDGSREWRFVAFSFFHVDGRR